MKVRGELDACVPVGVSAVEVAAGNVAVAVSGSDVAVETVAVGVREVTGICGVQAIRNETIIK
jgi:hypothetical protein